MNTRHVLGCTLLVFGLVTNSVADPEPVAAALKPPATATLTLATHGVGVQIYTCQPMKEEPDRYSWTLSAPEAQIAGADGKPIGKHYAGPTWEAMDGSTVVGEVVAHDDGPDASAIPWLLLRAKSTSGRGLLSGVTFIQRLNTTGGKAPGAGCNSASAGQELRVKYSADYNFYASRR